MQPQTVVINETELIDKYNSLVDKAKSLPNMPARDLLSKLSDYELFVFVAGQTLAYGRSFQDSVQNAQYHMGNGRDSIIRLWGYKDPEDIF